jgi:hypothetical protein
MLRLPTRRNLAGRCSASEANWQSVILDRRVTSVSRPFLRRRKSECDRRVMEASEGGSGAKEVGAFSSTECREGGFSPCDGRLNGVSMPGRGMQLGY